MKLITKLSKRRYKICKTDIKSIRWFKDDSILYRKIGPSVIWNDNNKEQLWLKGSNYFRIDGPSVVKNNENLWSIYKNHYYIEQKYRFCEEEFYWNY